MYTAGSNESRFGGARGRMKKSAKNAQDDAQANQRIDGMTPDDLHRAAFGTPATNIKKAKTKPVKKQSSKTQSVKKDDNNRFADRKKADNKANRDNKVKTFEEDILMRSVSNASEDFDDDTIKESADKHENCSAPHFEETEDFNKTVRDLIVFGPNCKMSYERDFIAEGEKMLNLIKG